jgi:DNA polymerase-3 subunit epsilon
MISDSNVVYVDTETTGIGGRSEIVDIAVVDARGDVLLDSLVKPLVSIPSEASAIHGIYDRDVAFAPSWSGVHHAFTEAVRGRTVVVYNQEYDRGIVNYCCARDGLTAPSGQWQCAMLAFSSFHGDWNGYFGNYRWHKLDAAAALFGLRCGGHRALGDAQACRSVVTAMAQY